MRIPPNSINYICQRLQAETTTPEKELKQEEVNTLCTRVAQMDFSRLTMDDLTLLKDLIARKQLGNFKLNAYMGECPSLFGNIEQHNHYILLENVFEKIDKILEDFNPILIQDRETKKTELINFYKQNYGVDEVVLDANNNVTQIKFTFCGEKQLSGGKYEMVLNRRHTYTLNYPFTPPYDITLNLPTYNEGNGSGVYYPHRQATTGMPSPDVALDRISVRLEFPEIAATIQGQLDELKSLLNL